MQIMLDLTLLSVILYASHLCLVVRVFCILRTAGVTTLPEDCRIRCKKETKQILPNFMHVYQVSSLDGYQASYLGLLQYKVLQ